MVDLQNKIISLNGKNYPIVRFEVWWHCPGGFFTLLPEALSAASVLEGVDPNLAIRAIPVAVAENGMYEPLGG